MAYAVVQENEVVLEFPRWIGADAAWVKMITYLGDTYDPSVMFEGEGDVMYVGMDLTDKTQLMRFDLVEGDE